MAVMWWSDSTFGFPLAIFAELPVMFIKKLENKTVQEQDSVELEVELSRPSTEVKWMKNGIVLQPEGNLKIQVDGVKQTLIFQNVTCADRGLYSCETLDDKTQAKLTVESKPPSGFLLYKPILSFQNMDGMECDDSESTDVFKPHRNTDANQGHTVCVYVYMFKKKSCRKGSQGILLSLEVCTGTWVLLACVSLGDEQRPCFSAAQGVSIVLSLILRNSLVRVMVVQIRLVVL